MTTAHQLPKKAFPLPYQVDFIAENKGRKGTNTKRKLVWKFGFAHPPAVFPHLYDENENYIGDKDGKSNTSYTEKKGVECRGREHEIVLTWSLLTGKAHIYVDSKEIYRHAPVSTMDYVCMWLYYNCNVIIYISLSSLILLNIHIRLKTRYSILSAHNFIKDLIYLMQNTTGIIELIFDAMHALLWVLRI